MRTIQFGWVVVAALLPLAMGCETNEGAQNPSTEPAGVELALDNMDVPPTGMSLLVLAEGADWQQVADTVEKLGGATLHVLPPRLLVARVASGSDPVLHQTGVISQLERAVEERDIPGATTSELRFARVFSNRYYREQLPEKALLRPTHAVVPENEQWEESAKEEAAATAARKLSAARSTTSVEDDIIAESAVYVPYASGTVVVSVLLPESNGVGEPSTEDWTEDQIAEVYEKIQTALEAFTRHEENSDLRFILHYESKPAEGGLVGTIDHDWEFGKQANWGAGSNEGRSISALLGKILDRDLPEGDWWQASQDYINQLRAQYNADAAFYVMVAGNGNDTASLRAHAYLYGPNTTLHSHNDWSVFMHEFGHIFGAGDEYCPDACWLPTSTHGYLGAINANATYQDGGPGINNGHGESLPSLMSYNAVNALNGYTRSAFGWLDADGDGLVEVRDTYPVSELEAVLYRGGSVRLIGLVTDMPQSSLGRTLFSVNRIARLEYRFADVEGSPWFELPINGQQRGREYVNVNLGTLPEGKHTLEVRAVNSVGNTEPSPQRLIASGVTQNTAPHLRLSTTMKVGGTATQFPIQIDYLDLEGDEVTLSLDLDADGSFEIVSSDPASLAGLTTPTLRPGRQTIRARATDAAGNSRDAELELLVLAGNAPPALSLKTPTTQVNGSARAEVSLSVSDLLEPEGEEVLYNWIVETAGDPYNPQRVETGFGAPSDFSTVLTTPLRIPSLPLDFTAGGTLDIFSHHIRYVALVNPTVVALALGKRGIALFDITDRKAPRLLSQLSLETSAYNLRVEGDRLFVLGGQLAVVDISDLSAPEELTQWWPTFGTISSKNEEPVDIWNAGWGASHDHSQGRDEKIVDLAVKVMVDHPDPSQLTIMLESDKDIGVGALTLMDRDPKAKNRRTFNFTTANTPALREAIGAFTGGSWSVAVYDQSGDGGKDPVLVGRLLSSRVRFNTEHRAIPVIEGANRVLGVVNGDYVVVTGNGLQVIDTFWPSWSTEVAKFTSTPIYGAALVGHRAIVGSLIPKIKDEELSKAAKPQPVEPDVTGLFAVNLAVPSRPRITRQVAVGVESLAVVGTRFYATAYEPLRPKDGSRYTVVGNLASFFAGRAYELGRTEHPIREGAFGDERSLWTINDYRSLSRLDVSDPANVRLIESVDEPRLDQLIVLSSDEILGHDWDSTFVANLNERTSTMSRVYQVTLEAKDASGAVAREVRNFHVVPYAHAPSIRSVEVVSGRYDRDTFELAVRLDDPDFGASWDPYSMVRADFDNDGVFESSWSSDSSSDEIHLWNQFPTAGVYNIGFEARDGFYGRSELFEFTLEVLPYAERPCGGALGDTCEAYEYCFRGLENACDKATQGVCTLRFESCPKDDDEVPVCGCNGQDYARACDAWYEGINVAFEGTCPVIECNSNADCQGEQQYCAFLPNWDDPTLSCGAAGPGTCEPIPTQCYIFFSSEPGSFMPGRAMCACDGLTYASSCHAAQQAASIRHNGPCQDLPPID